MADDTGTPSENIVGGCWSASALAVISPEGPQGKGGVLATKGSWNTQGKGSASATKAVGTQGKGGVLQMATPAMQSRTAMIFRAVTFSPNLAVDSTFLYTCVCNNKK